MKGVDKLLNLLIVLIERKLIRPISMVQIGITAKN